jgi:protein TonB
LLLILVIAVALLLGWMLGRVTGRATAHKKEAPARVSANPDAVVPKPVEVPQAAMVSAPKANVRILKRVEPEYPEAARQQRIQGLVVLEATVGKDGDVQQLAVISGNPMLATAASAAVLKWRFKPVVQNRRAVQFQTRIRVDFVLP